MQSVSRLLRWSAASRQWAVACGVAALFVAGYAWLRGVTAGGLDVYEACGVPFGAGEAPELVIRDDMPPLQLTCVFSDGSTRSLVPDWVNSTFFLATSLGVFLLITAYANVLADAWRGATSS